MKHLKFIKDQVRAQVSKAFSTAIKTYDNVEGTFLEFYNSKGEYVEAVKITDVDGSPVPRDYIEYAVDRVITNLKKHL